MTTILFMLMLNWLLVLLIPTLAVFILMAGADRVSQIDHSEYFVSHISSPAHIWWRKLLLKISPQAHNFAFGLFIFYDQRYPIPFAYKNSIIFRKLKAHELCHVRQQLIFGAFCWVLYAAFHLAVGYKRNPFERWARSVESRVK